MTNILLKDLEQYISVEEKIKKLLNFNHRQSALFIITIVVAIIISEYMFVYGGVGTGIVLCLFLVIAIYIVVSIVRMDQNIIDSAESMALIPMYVMFTSSIPWFFISQDYLLPAVYAIIIGLCVWHMHEKEIDFYEVGFRKHKFATYVVLGSGIAIFTGVIEYYILRPEPSFPTFSFMYLLRDIIYMTFFVGVGEELMFRGLIQRDLIKTYGAVPGLLGQAVLFGVMHMTWRSTPEILFTFFAALLMGYLYYKTDSLIAPIALHGVNNTMLVAIMPYVVMGPWGT